MALALTFDDGPGLSTLELLRVLQAHDCKAAFFAIGENLRDGWWSEGELDPKEVASKVVRSGHVLGNHTMTHNARLELRELVSEIAECDALLLEVYASAGIQAPSPIPFRLPYGIRTFISEYMDRGIKRQGAALDNRLQALASVGRTHVHWTALIPDWQATDAGEGKRISELAVEHVSRMHEQGLNAVIALHDGRQREATEFPVSREATVAAVDLILTEAKKRGWATFLAPAVGH